MIPAHHAVLPLNVPIVTANCIRVAGIIRLNDVIVECLSWFHIFWFSMYASIVLILSQVFLCVRYSETGNILFFPSYTCLEVFYGSLREPLPPYRSAVGLCR